VLELIDKGTLQDLVKKHKKLPEDIIGSVSVQVLKKK